jgi:tRNA-(ms[2]io[6]A)-hydroxylase
MLHLHCVSPDRWLRQVDQHLDQILIDHAHCEKKAAGCAMNLMFAYIENQPLCQAMTEIINEELEHFQLVIEMLQSRGIRFRRLPPGHYGRRLHELVRKMEPEKAVDRLLIAGLIEARSCERFGLLRNHLREKDRQLAGFYDSLFEAEARHHATYVRLAKSFAPDDEVDRRLDALAAEEAKIIADGHALPRMHS